MDKTQVLAEEEGEFTTKRVLRIGDDYFYQLANGGERGSWDSRQNNKGFGTMPISRTEARAKMLEMGVEIEEVAKQTA